MKFFLLGHVLKRTGFILFLTPRMFHSKSITFNTQFVVIHLLHVAADEECPLRPPAYVPNSPNLKDNP